MIWTRPDDEILHARHPDKDRLGYWKCEGLVIRERKIGAMIVKEVTTAFGTFDVIESEFVKAGNVVMLPTVDHRFNTDDAVFISGVFE